MKEEIPESSNTTRKRPPGRPRKLNNVNDILMDIGDTNVNVLINDNNHDNNTETKQSDNPATKKTRTYQNWWDSDFIWDILDAYEINKSAWKTVSYLQKRFPNDRFNNRFADLAVATVDGWFDRTTHQLLPEYELKLGSHHKRDRQNSNRIGVLDQYPLVKASVIANLTKMRAANAPMKLRNIRIIMKAVIQFEMPELLKR